MSILKYEPQGLAAQSYRDLAKEVLDRDLAKELLAHAK
jgi:hypothetical protein